MMGRVKENRDKITRLGIRERLRREHGSRLTLSMEDRLVSYIMANFEPNNSVSEDTYQWLENLLESVKFDAMPAEYDGMSQDEYRRVVIDKIAHRIGDCDENRE